MARVEDVEPFRLERALCQRAGVAELGRRLLGEVVAECGGLSAALWLVSADSRHMEGCLSHGPVRDIIEFASVPVENSVVGMVASTGLASSIGPDDYHNPSIDEKTGVKTKAMIVAPVSVAGELCGVISLINPTHGGVFAGADLEKLQWKAYLMGLLLADQCGDARGE